MSDMEVVFEIRQFKIDEYEFDQNDLAEFVSVEYYRKITEKYFTDDKLCLIKNKPNLSCEIKEHCEKTPKSSVKIIIRLLNLRFNPFNPFADKIIQVIIDIIVRNDGSDRIMISTL